MQKLLVFFLLLGLMACATLPPQHSEDLCATFVEKDEWFDDAQKSYQKWGIPIPVIMAIMYQESHYVPDAKPPRPWLLGFIPWFRESSAYGYAQAKDETWDDYQRSTKRFSADRDDFSDAADFIGWYCYISHIKLQISKSDIKNLYLAYHEGHKGYRYKTYLKKAWLSRVADKVSLKAKQFQQQLALCKI